MRVLHIINDYNFTTVHKELVYHLDKLNVEQKIFVPLKNIIDKGNNEFEFVEKGSEFLYSRCLKRYHKLFYSNRIKYLYFSLREQIDLEKISITHASTLFVDGGLALKLKKDYGIKYIVAVRNSDINFYMKYRKDLLNIGIEILKNANKIIFISDANFKLFIRKFQRFDISFILEKSIIQNNGVNNAWLNTIKPYERSIRKQKKFLFIGRFDSNKNVLKLIESFISLNSTLGTNHELILVGGGGGLHDKVLKRISNAEQIVFKGSITNVNELISLMCEIDFFAMCSFKETFGLVYIEALSKGKPILYSKEQGIDGTFGDLNIGEVVNPESVLDIRDGLENLVKNSYFDINKIDFDFFSWIKIAKNYKKLYEKNY
ncbi:glycosyltransferase [Myroides odoratimimus]|uniref:glycosyltransferase n=1 Tax=Myroides odoratimimus TaxID=76832 RepID=UPI003F4440A8